MITLSIKDGNPVKTEVEFRPHQRRDSVLGKIVLEAEAFINAKYKEHLEGMKAPFEDSIEVALVESKTEVPAKEVEKLLEIEVPAKEVETPIEVAKPVEKTKEVEKPLEVTKLPTAKQAK